MTDALDSKKRPPNEAALIASFNRLDFEAIARQVFDRFLLLQPDVPVEGLFRAGREYVIVTPVLDRVVDGGRTLKEWFDNELHPAAMPIHIAGAKPEGAEEVAPRTPRDVLLARGTIRTWYDLDRDLSLALPNDIPLVGVSDDDRTAVIRVTRALTTTEQRVVESSFEGLGSALPMRIEVVPPPEPIENPRRPDRIELRTARRLPPSTPQVVRAAVESDEDVWRRTATFSSTSEAAERVADVAPWPEVHGRSCLVATTFPPTNIRSYLSLYPTLVLVAPIKDALDPTLSALGIPKAHLFELARRGLVRFLVPQSIERYDQAWLAELLEAAPGNVLLSRRLAAVALRDQYRRNPLLSLPGNAYERRAILRALGRCSEGVPQGAALFLKALAQALSEYWDAAEYTLQVRGAMGSLTGGLARFGAAVTKALFNKDLFIEISATAQDVEWAGALGAHLVPEHGENYSSEKAAGLLIALSSGVPKAGVQVVASARQFDLAEELLAFDNHTDVLDFVTDLGSGDLARFRELVPSIARGSRPEAELRELVSAWNGQVRAYERKPDRVKTYGLAGLALAGASAASASETIRSVVPLVAPLIPFLTTKMTEDEVRDSPLVGRLLDWANATLAGTAPEAVLLSRLRKRVAGMKGVP